jgi:hypothetical protein
MPTITTKIVATVATCNESLIEKRIELSIEFHNEPDYENKVTLLSLSTIPFFFVTFPSQTRTHMSGESPGLPQK